MLTCTNGLTNFNTHGPAWNAMLLRPHQSWMNPTARFHVGPHQAAEYTCMHAHAKWPGTHSENCASTGHNPLQTNNIVYIQPSLAYSNEQ